ncbi:xylulokinase [Schaalia turicensis ACS-279-V-Col4]|uniref:Xylulose kinase n=1 Tax=Schaalia turicensis ACS-279-V-Col4 TaxID=883077 RepID=K0ZD64_9ACTO|nr:xylulokinase [Schaalia turicensis]EJZ85405.1 xylulokinase [Schaalia turicensis ACS-279-V-Col4]
MTNDRLVIGIDLSTQSCTVEARRVEDFEVVARQRLPLASTTPPVSEQNADDWWEALVQAFHLMKADIDLQAVRAIGVSGQCHGLVPLDGDNRVIRPVKLWNDTTSAPQIDALITRFGADYWAQRVGSVPTAAFTIGKLAWLIENEPATIARLHRILLPHDYLVFKLTGEAVTDRSEASGTGYFNSQSNSYDFELLRGCFGDVLTWESLFPRVGQPNDVAGTVLPDVANLLGLPTDAVVTVGGGDQHMAALGLGINDGDVVFSLGTSGVVYTSSSVPVTSGIVDGVANVVGGYLPLACTLNCTKVTDWAARLLGVSVQELDQLALDAYRSHDPFPVFAAYLDGERSPAYPGTTGVIAGLTSDMTREQFAEAIFVGVIAGLLRGLDAIHQSGVSTDGRAIAVGGGARSAAYTQIIADLLGRSIDVIREPEATARGACIQALSAITTGDVVIVARDQQPSVLATVNPQGHLSWDEVRDRYISVCDYAASTAHLRS